MQGTPPPPLLVVPQAGPAAAATGRRELVAQRVHGGPVVSQTPTDPRCRTALGCKPGTRLPRRRRVAGETPNASATSLRRYQMPGSERTARTHGASELAVNLNASINRPMGT